MSHQHARGRSAGTTRPALVARGRRGAGGRHARGPTRPTTCWCSAAIQEWDDELARLLEEAQPRPVAGGRRTPAVQPVRDRAGPAARRPRRLRRRPGPADAAAAVAGGALRHPVPRLGREPLRPAATCSTPTTCRAARDAGIDDDADLQELIAAVRGRAVRRPACRTPSRRRSRWCSPARSCAAASTRSTPTARRRRLAGRRLEDQPRADRRPAAARALPAGLGRAARRAARAGAGAVLLRAHRRPRRARRPPRPRCAGAGVRVRRPQSRSAAVSAISTISPNVCSRSAAVVSSPVTMWSETVQMASARRPCFAARV